MRCQGLLLLLSALFVAGCTDPGADPARDPHRSEEPQGDSAARAPLPADSAVPAGLRFTELGTQAGIDFVHYSGDNAEKPFPAANGSGIAAFDYDLDGWIDVLFLTGAEFPLSVESATTPDQIYRNVGEWQFRNVTAETGLGHTGYSAGPAVGDFNADGFPDVYVNCYGPNRLYLNQGDGTFRELSAEAGVDDPSWGAGCAALDFDGDGDLDLYVCNYAEWSWEANVFCGNREKNVRIFCTPRSVKPIPDRLYENLGDGRFRDALASAGLDREPGRGQGVVAADLDRDGLIDLYVSNDANPNFLFRNLGNGTFEDLSDVSGTASDYAGRLQAGMGVDVADVDRDGWWDLFVTNYEGEHNAFYKNFGDNLFQDVSQPQGLAAPSLRWVGWGTSFTDFDLDGWSDLVVTNGHTDNNLHEMGRDSEYRQPALLFHNDGGRLKQVLTGDGYFGGTHPGRALCAADLDRDADLDLIIGHQDEPPAVLRNDAERAESRRVVSLKLIGTSSNRDGIGATVEALGVEPSLSAQWKSGASYLAAFPHEAVLSLPADETVELQIRWPGGQVDRRAAPPHPGRYALVEGGELMLLESFIHSERATHEY